MRILLTATVFALLLINPAQAQILSSNSTGGEKNIFYTNETVYITTTANITAVSQQVRIYIVANNDTWVNNTALTDVSGGYKTLTTNSSGHLQSPNSIWSSNLVVGKYDIVADTNQNGIYESSTDFIDSTSATGFEIFLADIPILTVSKGSNSPADHEWNSEKDKPENIMLQLKLSANDVEDIQISSISALAKGTGDDVKGIAVVKIIDDANNSGTVEPEEQWVAFDKYGYNDGVLNLKIDPIYTVKRNSSAYLLFVYTMTNSSITGETFSFQAISISAKGASGKIATVSGLSINSATKTVRGPPVCSSYTTQTSCEYATCKWCVSDNSCRKTSEPCPVVCSGSISMTLNKQNDIVTATVSGLSNCDGKTIQIRQESCTGNQISSCTALGSGCTTSFPTTKTSPNTYYACVDRDNSQTISADEQTYASLPTEQQSPLPQIPGEVSTNWTKIILIIFIPVVLIGLTLWYMKKRHTVNEFEELKKKWESKK